MPSLFCGGCAWGVLVQFSRCLINVCVPRRKVPSQHAPPECLSFLCPVLLSCCLSSVAFFVCAGSGRFMVGARARRACFNRVCVCVCVCVRACACALVLLCSWVFCLVSTFGFKLLLTLRPLSYQLLSPMAEVPAVRLVAPLAREVKGGKRQNMEGGFVLELTMLRPGWTVLRLNCNAMRQGCNSRRHPLGLSFADSAVSPNFFGCSAPMIFVLPRPPSSPPSSMSLRRRVGLRLRT